MSENAVSRPTGEVEKTRGRVRNGALACDSVAHSLSPVSCTCAFIFFCEQSCPQSCPTCHPANACCDGPCAAYPHALEI